MKARLVELWEEGLRAREGAIVLLELRNQTASCKKIWRQRSKYRETSIRDTWLERKDPLRENRYINGSVVPTHWEFHRDTSSLFSTHIKDIILSYLLPRTPLSQKARYLLSSRYSSIFQTPTPHNATLKHPIRSPLLSPRIVCPERGWSCRARPSACSLPAVNYRRLFEA